MTQPKTMAVHWFGFATLGLTAVLLSCTPSKSPDDSPATAPGPALQGSPSSKPASAPASEAAKGISPALKDLRARIEPKDTPTAATQPGEVPAKPALKESASRIEGAEKLTESARKVALELAAALEEGDLKKAEELCVGESSLVKVLTPSYISIIGDGIPAQNKSALQHLANGLQGKKWTPEFLPGKLSRAPVRGPFLDGLTLMSEGSLRLNAEGISLEAHLDQLVLIGDDWRIFRLSAP